MSPRSPILFWLLLAATLAVDAVAIALLFDTNSSQLVYALFWALAFGQLSVICIRIVLLRAKVGATWLLAFIASLLFALALFLVAVWQDGVSSIEDFVAVTGLFSTHIAAVLISLWLLKPTRLSAPIANTAVERPWQFALRHLLIVTTCLALLAFVLSHNNPLVNSILDVLSLMLANVVLLIGVVASARSRSTWPLSLAISLAIAIGIAVFCNAFSIAFATDMNLFALFLVQAIVIWAWLELYCPPRQDDVRPDVAQLAPEATSQ